MLIIMVEMIMMECSHFFASRWLGSWHLHLLDTLLKRVVFRYVGDWSSLSLCQTSLSHRMLEAT